MERRVEVVSGLGAAILGLIGVVMESRALSNPLSNPYLAWMAGTPSEANTYTAIAPTQHALLPIALILVLLAFGAYLHGVHDALAGLVLLVTSSVVVIAVAALAGFNTIYVQLLFVPAPLVVLPAILAGVASICALSSGGRSLHVVRRVTTGSAG